MKRNDFYQSIETTPLGLEITIEPDDCTRVISEARTFLEMIALPREISAYCVHGRDCFGFYWSMTFDDETNPRDSFNDFPEYEVIAARLYLYDEPEDIFIDFLVRDN